MLYFLSHLPHFSNSMHQKSSNNLNSQSHYPVSVANTKRFMSSLYMIVIFAVNLSSNNNHSYCVISVTYYIDFTHLLMQSYGI